MKLPQKKSPAVCLPECGVARFLTVINGEWATLIVRELLPGPCRFTELRDALPGISAHTLTRCLRRFEAYGVVERRAYPEVPPRVDYRLTPVGGELRHVLNAMGVWAGLIGNAGSEAKTDETRIS